MTGKTHKKIGLLAPIALGAYLLQNQIQNFNLINMTTFTILSVIGSTFPDIDQTQSISGKQMPISANIIKGMHFISEKLSMKGISKATSHRGLTHSVVLWFALFVAFYFANSTINFITPISWGIYGFFFGVGTHLFLDMLTRKGIPVLAPFSYLSFRFLSIKTSSVGEKVMKIILSSILIAIICFNLYLFFSANPLTIDLDFSNIRIFDNIKNTIGK